MASSLVTKRERNTAINRLMKSSPDYTPYTQAQYSTDVTDPSTLDTTLSNTVGSKEDFESKTENLNDLEVQVVTGLNSLTGNSSTIGKVATFNTDSPERIGTIASWAGTAKDNTFEIKSTIVNRIMERL